MYAPVTDEENHENIHIYTYSPKIPMHLADTTIAALVLELSILLLSLRFSHPAYKSNGFYQSQMPMFTSQGTNTAV